MHYMVLIQRKTYATSKLFFLITFVPNLTKTTMKKTLLYVLLLGGFSISAQTLVGSAGATYKKSNATVSVSVGEAIVQTHSKSNTTVSQGFQQSTKLVITSIDDVKAGYTVFPNPTFDQVTINATLNGLFTLTLTDLSGKELHRNNTAENGTKINFTNYPKGIYIVKMISTDQKSTQTFKISKQ